jgi:hypothetical protein
MSLKIDATIKKRYQLIIKVVIIVVDQGRDSESPLARLNQTYLINDEKELSGLF